MSKWTKVKDALPRNKGFYLVYVRSICTEDTGIVSGGKKILPFEVSFYGLGNSDVWDYEVTHWMELPDDPSL